MIRASQIFFWFGLTIAASVMLYQTSDRVNQLDQQLRDLNASIESEQQSLHVLQAEWVYLANPARIETLAHKHLSTRPTATTQIVRLEDLNEILPTRTEAMSRVAVTATPIASIHTTLAGLSTPDDSTNSHAKTKAPITVASVDTGHINERMIMQRTASAQPLPDSIGALINDLGTHP